MAKRIFWLFNHTSLRNFELPLLRDMGYEIYCPKHFTVEFGDYSASVTYDYDKDLTISPEDLRTLNDADLYNGFSPEIMAIINRWFDIAFVTNMVKPLRDLAFGYKGVLVLHTFGWIGNISSTDFIKVLAGYGLLSALEKMGERFWFAPTYAHLTEIESPFMQNRSVYLPIGMKDVTLQRTWQGGDPRFLFVCPKIQTNPYYNGIYRQFQRDFGKMPHVIGGAQPQPVENDSTVTGFLPAEEYAWQMDHLCAMYYHCTEMYHLQYHPLEAIRRGMPVVFMAGGMLDKLGGKNLPGRCKNVQEAKNLLRRLSNGDRKLIQTITSSQPILLDKFSLDYCKPFWEAGMQKIERIVSANAAAQPSIKKKRIALVMPAPYTGGVLDYSIRFAVCLQDAIIRHKAPIELVFSYPDFPIYREKDYFTILKKKNIPLRTYLLFDKDYTWRKRTEEIMGFQTKKGSNISDVFETFSALKDNIADYSDCDYIIYTADGPYSGRTGFMLQPYAVVAHDYIQRYCPECISPDADRVKLDMQRKADRVFVTSAPTMTDAIQYAGLPKEKVFLTPLMLDPMEPPKLQIEEEIPRKPYFLWSTNAVPHKNHLRALAALEQYYIDGGMMNCVVTGANTKYLGMKKLPEDAPVLHSYVMRIVKRISDSSVLKKHLKIKGELPKINYQQLLSHAAFVFHPGYGDNGNGTAVDAAGMGIPTLSSDYPAMHYLAEFMGMPMQYMNPFRTESMAEALLDMEKNHEIYSQALPSREKLMEHDYRAQGEALYQIIKQVVGV